MSILNQIANPNVADVRGQFEEGRKIGQQNLTKDLAGKILNETLGSKLGMQAYTDLQNVNPDAAIKLKQAIQTDSDSAAQYFLGVTKAGVSILDGGGTPEDVSAYYVAQAPLVAEDGYPGLAQKMVAAAKALKDPSQQAETLKNMRATYEGLGGGGNEGKGTGQREFEDLISGFSPEDQVKARRISAGLDGRASNNALMTSINNGTLKEYLDGVEDESGAKETGALQAKFKLSPGIAEAVRLAQGNAQSVIDASGEERSNEVALRVYEAGINSLTESLSDTSTGPFVGWIPAMTENQQIADGSLALMAPIMKQIFRAAGEGVFTKDDQETLMAILPDRKDKPAARISKFKMVDSVVRSKLMPMGPPERLSPSGTPPKSRFQIEVVN